MKERGGGKKEKMRFHFLIKASDPFYRHLTKGGEG
jgi:hypothetical protein